MRVAKLRVGILRVEVRAKRASIWVNCETSECARRLLKDRRLQFESMTSAIEVRFKRTEVCLVFWEIKKFSYWCVFHLLC